MKKIKKNLLKSYAIYCLISVFCIFGLSSCSLFEREKPVPEVVDTNPSWDGTEQNSGVLDFIEGEGLLITPKAAKRYTALSEKHSKLFLPPLKSGEGLIPKGDNFILPPEYVVKFAVMNKKNKE